MANNVYCNLQLNKANNDSETEWKRAFSLLSIDKGLEFLDIYRTNEETPDGSFMDEFIGARSAELIDMNFDVCTKNDYIFEHEIKSSWTPPLKFFEELLILKAEVLTLAKFHKYLLAFPNTRFAS